MNYYNENDKFAAEWLRNLIKDGLIPQGVVDERDIRDVQGDDVKEFTQCHFFAGIGGWPYALRLAGWPEDRSVWTGSCPCQDFSNSGKQAGFAGKRDLWPIWFKLVGQRGIDVLFGEQVDDSTEWYDRTCNDLESLNYAIGACVVPACSVGLAQERARLFFVAHSAALNGKSHDRVVSRGIGRSPAQLGRLSGVEVVGGRWSKGTGSECLPTLVRNFDGLSGTLAGLGNAIVPEVAAAFIMAAMPLIPTPSCNPGDKGAV